MHPETNEGKLYVKAEKPGDEKGTVKQLLGELHKFAYLSIKFARFARAFDNFSFQDVKWRVLRLYGKGWIFLSSYLQTAHTNLIPG